jgi:hypothetical protein
MMISPGVGENATAGEPRAGHDSLTSHFLPFGSLFIQPVRSKSQHILVFRLDLNLARAAREAAGHPITLPGLPLPESERSAFLTDDCIRV